MVACTSVSPGMARAAGLCLSLLLRATLVLSSSVTSQTSAPLAPPEKPIRQSPFSPSQQGLRSLNVAPAAYDLALLNDDDLSAFEEETAIENEPKRAKFNEKTSLNNYRDINSNDVDFPNYYDSDKPIPLDYDSHVPDSNYDTKIIDQNLNALSYDPIAYENEDNIESQTLKGNQKEIDRNNAVPTFDNEQEDKEIGLNKKELTVNGNTDEYALEPNRNEEYEKEKNDGPNYNYFESMNEDYAQKADAIEVRKKRESESTLNKTKPRPVTGDTVLNIAGAVRDRIGELAPFASPPSLAPPPGPPPAPRGPAPPAGATRLDAVVIRSAASVPPPVERAQTDTDLQSNEVEEEGVVTAEVGARVVLKCDAPEEAGGNYTWTRDNEAVPGLQVDAAGALWLRASRAAAGVWRCERSAGAGRGTTLRIYEPAGLAWLRVEGRRLDLGRAWLPAREGSSLPLACHADGGVPPPVLVWRVTPASHLLTYNRTTYRDGVATSWASVLATRDLHNATITCEALQRDPTHPVQGQGQGDGEGQGEGQGEAGDDANKRLASVMLHVTFPPTFSISRRPGFGRALVAGRGAALRCDVSANPPPHLVVWTRQDEPLPQPLTVAGVGWAEARWVSLSHSHAGWYRCVCEWGGTTYSSIGYFLMLVPEADTDASLSDPQRCSAGKGACRRPVASEPRAAGSRPDSVVPSGAARARAISLPSAVLSDGGAARGSGRGAGETFRRVSCSVCGANVRARWVHGATSANAVLLTPHMPTIAPSPSHSTCSITTYYAPRNEEVWCVAVNEAGGDVAVFPPLAPPASPPLHPPASPPLHPPASPRAASQATGLFASTTLLVLLSVFTQYYDSK